MGRDVNIVTLIGRLTREPEIKYTPSGAPITKLSIANGADYTVNGNTTTYTNYFDITVFGNQAVNCEKYLKKGSQLCVSGTLKQNRWTDQATNQARSRVDITAHTIQFLQQPKDGQQQTESGQPNAQQAGTTQQQNGGFIEDPWGDNSQDQYPGSGQVDENGIPF